MGKKGGNKSPGENTRTPGSEGKCLMVSCEECGNLGVIRDIEYHVGLGKVGNQHTHCLT